MKSIRVPIRFSTAWVSKLSCFWRMDMLDDGSFCVIDSSKSSLRWRLMDFLLNITYAMMLIPHKTTSNKKHQQNNWNLSIIKRFHEIQKFVFFSVQFENVWNLLWFVQLSESNIFKKLSPSANGSEWFQISGKQYDMQASLWQYNCKCCENNTFKKITTMSVESCIISGR